jgi:general secretion pathway protein D
VPEQLQTPPPLFPGARSADAVQPPASEIPQKRQTVRSKEATITADPNTNTIIVVAKPDVQRIYEQLIKVLDKRRPQVLIECTIVTLDTSNNYSLGVEISGQASIDDTEIIAFSSFGLSRVGTGTADLGRLTLNPGMGFNGTVINADVAQLAVKALASSGRAEVVSAPKLVVNDNTTGTLASVQEAPFTSVNASNTVATTAFAGYASAGTSIAVTPHISEGDFLQLEYTVALNNFTGSGDSTAGTPPPRQTNQLTSKVTIPDGSTIIVGGLNRKNFSETVDAVPILGEIPILEYFFSNRTTSSSNSTLFVFIRPVVLRDDKFADLKFFSERSVKAAGIPADYPLSEPVIMK